MNKKLNSTTSDGTTADSDMQPIVTTSASIEANPLLAAAYEDVRMFVKSWRNTDKYPCPKCGSKLGMPTYTCEPCKVKLKIKMNF